MLIWKLILSDASRYCTAGPKALCLAPENVTSFHHRLENTGSSISAVLHKQKSRPLTREGSFVPDTQQATKSNNAAASSGSTGSLNAMRVAELQQLASKLGVKGISKLRKNDLIAAIRSAQSGGGGAGESEKSASAKSRTQSQQEDTRDNAPE